MKRYNQEKFNYKEYIRRQKYRANSNWGSNSTSIINSRTNLKNVWDKIKHLFKDNISVGCMGIRSGNMEFVLFKRLLPKSEIIGVDIHEKVTESGENCYCYDFNHLPKDWENKFDLIYSNSIDHAFDIKKTVKEWRRVLKPKGYLLLAFSTDDLGYADLYNFKTDDVRKLFPQDGARILKILENEFYALVRKK